MSTNKIYQNLVLMNLSYAVSAESPIFICESYHDLSYKILSYQNCQSTGRTWYFTELALSKI